MARMKAEQQVTVECVCGWRFATGSLRWAETLMRNHECERFVLTGRDDEAFELTVEEMDALETEKEMTE